MRMKKMFSHINTVPHLVDQVRHCVRVWKSSFFWCLLSGNDITIGGAMFLMTSQWIVQQIMWFNSCDTSMGKWYLTHQISIIFMVIFIAGLVKKDKCILSLKWMISYRGVLIEFNFKEKINLSIWEMKYHDYWWPRSLGMLLMTFTSDLR